MTDVFWLEQTAADLPANNEWLSANEAIRANGMRFTKRRADWLLGRWTAKHAVAAYWKAPVTDGVLADIEIRATASGAPAVFLAGEAAAVAISLSHRAGRAMCVVAPPETALGCDLEIVEPRSDAFVSDYFTAEEQALVAGAAPADQAQLVTLVWSAKESALKTLGVGLRLDTRSVQVLKMWGGPPGPRLAPWPALRGEPAPASSSEKRVLGTRADVGVCPTTNWRPLEVCCDGSIFHGWWQSTGRLLRTLVAAPAPRMPSSVRAILGG